MLRALALVVTLLLTLTAAGCGDSGSTPQQDAAPPGNLLVGEPCTAPADCQSRQCLTDELGTTLVGRPVTTNGGYCLLFPCLPENNDADCGQGAHCFDARPYGPQTNICLKTCSLSGDCRTAYECVVDVVPDGGGVQLSGCLPIGLVQRDAGVDDAGN